MPAGGPSNLAAMAASAPRRLKPPQTTASECPRDREKSRTLWNRTVVGEELGLRVRTGIYRAPSPAPGRYYGDPDGSGEGEG